MSSHASAWCDSCSVFLDYPGASCYDRVMAFTLEQLAEAALHLPVASRALLADRLVESLDLAEPGDIQCLWTAEAIRRREEARSGQVKLVPGEQALAEVRRVVGR